jgi:DnaJ-class molecular chaperone
MPKRKRDVIESRLCSDCHGTGYIPNDPDISRLQLCLTCSGTGEVDEERDFAQERIREQLEAAFSKNDPPEASPEDRRTGREIKEIAAMILQEVGGKK